MNLQLLIENELTVQFAVMDSIKTVKPFKRNENLIIELRMELSKSQATVRALHTVVERLAEQKIRK